MLYKGYRIRITNFRHQQYYFRIYLDDKEIAFKGYIIDSGKALELAKNEIDAITSNPYTPNSRPPYMWIPVDDDSPCNLSRVFAIWTDGTHKLLARSFIFDGKWTCLEYPQINDEKWCVYNKALYVTHWQYAPDLTT